MNQGASSAQERGPTGLGPLVILDTNVWLSEHLLTSRTGDVLLKVLTTLDGRIGLPSCVRNEVLAVATRYAREDFGTALHRLGVTFAEAALNRRLVCQPADVDLREAIDARLADLSYAVEEMPHTTELLEAALSRAIEGRPPSAPKREQYVDSLILEAAIAAGRRRNVHLITDDGAFYVGRKLENGVADEISTQLRSEGIDLHIHRDVAACAGVLSTLPPDIGPTRVAEQLAVLFDDEVRSAAQARGFVAVGDPALKRFTVIRIEQWPGAVFIAFALAYSLETAQEAATAARYDGSLVAAGDCTYDPAGGRVVFWNPDEIRIRWREADGSPREEAVKYGSVSMEARATLQGDAT